MLKLECTQKIFGIGLSRTGTKSLNAALNYIGINSIHLPHDEKTLRQLQLGDINWEVLQNYQAITDIMPIPYYELLDKKYPNSKFILTTRNKDQWLKAAKKNWKRLNLADSCNKQDTFNKLVSFLLISVYGCCEFNEEIFSMVYDRHLKNVTSYFSVYKEKLLIMNICDGDGWDVLCPFIRKSIPNIKFPSIKYES